MFRNLCSYLLLFLPASLSAQDNYEIQVYGSPTQSRGTAILELHSNYTFNGEKNIVDGVRPSQHALHNTLEFTEGISDILELGFYVFTNESPGYGYQYVGSHIRPRIRVPEKWKWPVGVSLSAEVGFQNSHYASDTWSMEIRPIVDKQMGRFYWAFNPTLGIPLKGDPDHTPSFEPNLKVSYEQKKLALGLEYYGSLGQLNQVPPLRDQSHALFLVADLDLHPDWEFNLGLGSGLTPATDGLVGKLILGHRIHWKKSH